MSRRQDALAVAVLVVIVAILFGDVLFGPRALALMDLATFHYPEKKALREVVLGGEFPYWFRALSAGQPLAANPQHEVFYPPNWLILLPDFTSAFHLLIALHVLLALIGMYALLRAIELDLPAALFGAISFGLGGAILSTLGLLPFLFSLAWMPLTCLFVRKERVVWGALSLAMQLLIGEPTIVLMTLLVIALHFRSRKAIYVVLLAPLIAAVQIVPALDHFADSVRARGFAFAVMSRWSMPLSRLAELFAPQHGSGFLTSIYCGLAVPLLAIAGVVRRVRGWIPFVASFAIGVVIALGAHTPLLRMAYDAGLVRWLRYPEKFMLFVLFATILFAARTLQALRLRPLWLALIGVAVLVDLGLRVPALMPRVPRSYYTTEPPIARTLPADRSRYRLLHEVSWTLGSPRVAPERLPWVLRDGMFALVPITYGFQTAIDIDYDLTALQPTDDFGRAAFALMHIRRDWADIVSPIANIARKAVYRGSITYVPTPTRPRYAFATKLVTIRSHRDFVRQLAARPDPGTAFVAQPSFVPAAGRVTGVHESANRATIDVDASGRAFLVISVTPHKYWTITIDGVETGAVIVNAGFQGVIVPAGRHRIEMRYRNPLIAAGAALSAATLLALAFVRMRAL